MEFLLPVFRFHRWEPPRSPSNVSVAFQHSPREEFTKELNSQANPREYLIQFLIALPVTSNSNTVQSQSASFAQLTEATNQLTRTVLVRISRSLWIRTKDERIDRRLHSLFSIGRGFAFHS